MIRIFIKLRFQFNDAFFEELNLIHVDTFLLCHPLAVFNQCMF